MSEDVTSSHKGEEVLNILRRGAEPRIHDVACGAEHRLAVLAARNFRHPDKMFRNFPVLQPVSAMCGKVGIGHIRIGNNQADDDRAEIRVRNADGL